MPNDVKAQFLDETAKRFGALTRLSGSQSLFEVGAGRIRLYVRYSKLHPNGRTFYGLRADDLRQLEGHPALIAFLRDDQQPPVIVPFDDYEALFRGLIPARDGQFKAQVYPTPQATELYVANAGRFNVEAHVGWISFENLVHDAGHQSIPALGHPQVQTLLGAIGAQKGFEVWVPSNDRAKLDWVMAKQFQCCDLLPLGYETVRHILEEVDVVWLTKGNNQLSALFEVEHSTPIYSGLLRFNDIHLITPNLHPRFSIVANNVRRDVFAKQLNRPTFKASGLTEMCNFLEYRNVFGWFKRTCV
jgi:hypothetical protein